MTPTAKANRYVRNILSGKVDACKWVKLACERWQNDYKRAEEGWLYQYNAKKADKFCLFVEKMPHIKGKWAKNKEKIRLEDWQCFIYCNVFGWYSVKTGERRFRVVYTEVPRKNAKSTMSAPVAMNLGFMDNEPGAEVYTTATKREQARIVFNIARRMAQRESGWRKKFNVEVGKHAIFNDLTDSKMEPLSADYSSLDGLNIYAAVVDELHAHKNRELFEVIETGTGARTQPLLWLITTAGTDRAGICYEQRTYCTKILERIFQDETYFAIIYTIDKDDDWTKEKSWKKANPNYGISVNPDDLRRKAKKAMNTPSAVNGFLTKHLDVWVNAGEAWMDMRQFEQCAGQVKIEEFLGEPCYVGIDLASKLDIASMYVMFTRVEDDGLPHYYFFGRNYLPEDQIEESPNAQYAGWAKTGDLITTSGSIIDYEVIETDLDQWQEDFLIEEVCYDPFQATQFATRADSRDFVMVEVGATVKNFSEPMKEMEASVIDGRFHFNNDPVLAWAVSNVVCHTDLKDNVFPRKELPQNKIDPVIACLMCINRGVVAKREEGEVVISVI